MIDEKLLKDFFYAIRGLKRRLYTHHEVPTTKDAAGPKIMNHRCQVCRHNAVGEADIEHHKSCPLARTQELWHELKAARPDLFDFSDRFPVKVAKEVTAVPNEYPTQTSLPQPDGDSTDAE